jgi:PTS system cellobiose-specific IIB component
MAEKKKVRVLLVCAIGMSSSLIEKKTTKVADDAGVPFEIQAIDVPEVGRWNFGENPVDVVLIAPQARFKIRSVKQAAEPHGIIVENIDTVAYGMMDGEKIFEQVMTAIKEHKSNK